MTLPTFKNYLIQEAKKDTKGPATRDRVKGIMKDPDATETDESRPATKRRGQRAVRALRRRYGLKHPMGEAFGRFDDDGDWAYDNMKDKELDRKNDEFSTYMKEVDKILSNKFGFGHRDLPDYMWMDMFEDEVDPETAVEDFIEWAGLDMF